MRHWEYVNGSRTGRSFLTQAEAQNAYNQYRASGGIGHWESRYESF